MHVDLAGVSPRTEDLLDFVVVGGGIAGLATAWSLQTVGHRVTLLEQHTPDVMSKCREGVRSTPTMTQILDEWGIGDKLSSISIPIMQMTFLDGKTAEELGLIAVNGKVMESLPADFSCVQYGALFNIFYDLVKDAGVDLHFNTKVVSVDPWQGSVTCEDGQQWIADVIVGADGTESVVRPAVLESSAPPPDRDNRFTVNLVVPADVARQDEELAGLLDGNSWTGWFADDCSMHGVLTGPGPNYDYALVLNLTIHSEDVLEEFPMSLESLRVDLFEPRAQKLLKMSEQLSKVVFNHYEPFENWVHESGKVVLVGEAAHPIIPSGSHNTCACIEDAMTLSTLFSLPATKPQTPMLLNVFEELRQPRCASVQRYVRRKREVITIPHGPGQRRRDELLRSQRACHQEDELDDEFLCNTYSGFLQIYGFDAREAVQDWWVKLGKSILTRSPNTENEGEYDDDDNDDDAPISLPVVVDAEVEREGPTYPIISDPLMGEDEDVVREAEAQRRGQQ
ncbi:FAD/NAD(P)-binding domain-containing protein, partial [Imleria badia]